MWNYRLAWLIQKMVQLEALMTAEVALNCHLAWLIHKVGWKDALHLLEQLRWAEQHAKMT